MNWISALTTLPNLLTLSRGPIALLLLAHNDALCLVAVFLAMASDILDGFLARRWHLQSRVGTVLDPIMDRVFAFTAIAVLIGQGRLDMIQVMALIARDAALLLFGAAIVVAGSWHRVHPQALWVGKASTSLQFVVFIIIWGYLGDPTGVCVVLLGLGAAAVVELVMTQRRVFSSTS